MAAPVTRRHFTVDEYHRLAEAGILTEDDRIELIAGELVTMSPIGTRHAACVKRLNRLLGRALGVRALIGVQDPIWLGDETEPQPDLAVLRPRPDDYARGHPTASDVLLLIEVADTSQRYDREVKVPLYARAGIPEVWLVDLTAETIERYAEPANGTYRQMERAGRGQTLIPTTLPGFAVSVDAVLG